MMKIILIGIMSLGLIACESGEDAKDSSSSAIYGLDFNYDGTHPDEISVSPQGKLEPFTIDGADVATSCGRHFYKEPISGNVFYAKNTGGQWVAEQIGQYQEYNEALGGFQTVGYNKMEIFSVGRFVVFSSCTPEFIAEYGDVLRANYTDPVNDAGHENCMLYIDEEGQDVYNVALPSEVMTSIF